MTSDDFSVALGVRPGHRRVAAQSYWSAFSGKLRYPLAPEHKALDFLEKVINPDYAMTAVASDGRFLGAAGFKTPDGAFINGHFRDLEQVYGRWNALVRGVMLGVLERDCEPGTLLMDGIFVCPQARGLGVGSALLRAIERYASDQGYRQVRLDVIEENGRARALYERQGFKAVSRLTTGPLKSLFGFKGLITMTKLTT